MLGRESGRSKSVPPSEEAGSVAPASPPAGGAPVIPRMSWVGANQGTRVDGFGAFPSTSNYLIGSHPDHWRTRVPIYSKVEYRVLYPGIDAPYYGRGGQLEYDLVVSPGANPDILETQPLEPYIAEVKQDLERVSVRHSKLQHRKRAAGIPGDWEATA